MSSESIAVLTYTHILSVTRAKCMIVFVGLSWPLEKIAQNHIFMTVKMKICGADNKQFQNTTNFFTNNAPRYIMYNGSLIQINGSSSCLANVFNPTIDLLSTPDGRRCHLFCL